MNAAIILQTLNAVQALLLWLTGRGISRDRVLAILERANDEGRDVTTAEVQVELDRTKTELVKTKQMIDAAASEETR